MKDNNRTVYSPYLLLTVLLSVFISCGNASAAETAANWRPTYDIIMMWINFLILVFLVFKFGKTPLMEFLEGRKLEISEEINQIEGKKEKLTNQVKQAIKTLDESDIHLAKFKEKIVGQGEKKKHLIIKDAEQQCRFMLETAQHKIENHIMQAEAKFRAELIDAATEHALEILPRKITPEDNRKMLNEYLEYTLLIQKTST
ncbi:MAG: ATP synthase F0 subunit B [Deltaproteobacteria bacterium]|nr:ATP synthase F0 subunit B [Deltaproteobacteria bacterium]